MTVTVDPKLQLCCNFKILLLVFHKALGFFFFNENYNDSLCSCLIFLLKFKLVYFSA